MKAPLDPMPLRGRIFHLDLIWREFSAPTAVKISPVSVQAPEASGEAGLTGALLN